MNREQRRFMLKKDAARKFTNLLYRVIDSLDLKGLLSLQSYINSKIAEKEGN